MPALRQPGGLTRSRATSPRAIALAAILAGCVLLAWTAYALAGRADEPRVRGTITEVVARDIGHAASISLRSEDGRQLRFRIDDSIDWTPGHLREHMTFGQPITVYYRRAGDTLLAIRVDD